MKRLFSYASGSFALLTALAMLTIACGPTSSRTSRRDGGSNQDGSITFDGGNDDDGGSGEPDLSGGDPPIFVVEDPKTCDEAAANKSYVGCDYWPTAVANSVHPDFDFTVVVANTSAEAANITITGPNSTNVTDSVAPGTLKKISLPWVNAINPVPSDYDFVYALTESIKATGAAYHLVSDRPVVVYQFSPLQYTIKCTGANADADGNCYSYSNDASLLLPSTAMTGNYRIAAAFANAGMGSYFAITATADDTSITIKAGANVKTLAGAGLAVLNANQTMTLSMNAGDVVELISDIGTKSSPAPDSRELSGTLVQSTKPIQIIVGDYCMTNPKASLPRQYTCDHVEETLMPTETLGKKYIVTPPSGPATQSNVKHTVRIVGNVDGTTLTFTPAMSGVKTSINAGEVIEIDSSGVNFLVEGDHEFAIVTVQKSAQIVDPTTTAIEQKGDPSLSAAVAVEQYRKNYVFLAPDDYDKSFVDIVLPTGANITLDGVPLAGSPTAIGSTGYQLLRVTLSNSGGGIHTLDSDVPIGIQVIGYGKFTSYQYPGGLNLQLIAPPPEPIG